LLPPSSNQPGRRPGFRLGRGRPTRVDRRHPCRPYSVLLPVGFAVPLPLPAARCALTAPFHPCRARLAPGAGGLFSVALSLGSPPAAVSRHRQSLEPGLSSTARFWPQSLIARQRPSSRLAGTNKGAKARRVKGLAPGQPLPTIRLTSGCRYFSGSGDLGPNLYLKPTDTMSTLPSVSATTRTLPTPEANSVRSMRASSTKMCE
jgi:hypothetical protein